MRPPLFSSLGGYDRSWLRGDLVAGLTVWAMLVPEALAYASIAGVSPVVGLYAAPGWLLLYRASRPHVAVLGQVPGMPGQYGDLARHPENLRRPGVALLRVEGGLFFANADTVRRAEADAALPRTFRTVQDAVDALAGPESPARGEAPPP